MILSSKSISGVLYLWSVNLYFLHYSIPLLFICNLLIPHCDSAWINIFFLLLNFFFVSSSGKIRTSNAFIGLPYHTSQSSGCQLRGHNCYVKVSHGCSKSGSDKALDPNSNYIRNLPKHHSTEASAVGRGYQKGSLDLLSVHEKIFIYPSEAVLVPVLQTSFARSSLRRCVWILW